MIGGVLLGSLYLGVDLRGMAASVLHPSRPVSAKETPQGDSAESTGVAVRPPAIVASNATPALAAQQNAAPARAAQTEHEPVAVAPRVSATPIAPTVPSQAVPASPTPGFADRLLSLEDATPVTDKERKDFTLAYWQSLEECMKNEVTSRLSSVQDAGNWTLFDYLTGRKRGHEDAAASIAKLPRRGVDAHVLAYADRAQAWHAEGARLFARALDLLTDAPSSQLSGPFAQSWQSASTQHHMEERLLAEKHKGVESYLTNAYGSTGAAPTPQKPVAASLPSVP
jgi:hypothetical protein